MFGRYTLTKVLGRGGMGIVWLAHDEELERDVALKFLPDLMFQDRALLDQLKRETKRCLELTHKNIVRIYDFVHDERSGCISMEYVDGETLSNLRAEKEQKVFEPNELSSWTSQLCDALDYAHNHARIIHRDLKPANLMVNTRGDLKVSDFGISRSLSDSVSMLTMEQGRSGTLVFMSPQQLDGERGTHLDDIYSFGATVYELLASVLGLKSNPIALIGAAAAVIFIAGIAVWLFGFHKPAQLAPAPPPPVAVTKPKESGANALGGVMVNTSPPRATVTLGGMD